MLVEKDLAPSREKAKALIMAGLVRVSGVPVACASDQFDEACEFTLAGDNCPYVSRGGLKLEKAMREFGIDLAGKTCLDIGCSTGGFTDCMLQNGAAFVYGVDVGYGQFDWRLRNDERVKLLERTNARYLDESSFEKPVDFASIDVSFISLRLILPVLLQIKHSNTLQAVVLVKPQFEAGREKVGKKGVVRDPKVHAEVLHNVLDFAQNAGFGVIGLDFSPVKGPNGNIEYLAYLQAGADCAELKNWIESTVENSHKSLVL